MLLAGCGGGPVVPSANVEPCYPRMSDSRPAGELPAGTRTAVMSLVTDRPAVCRWGTVEGEQYVELPNAFDMTGGTTHTTLISGFVDGGVYRWYAKCAIPGTSCVTPHDLVFGFHVAGS
jgi:hypothetical protein